MKRPILIEAPVVDSSRTIASATAVGIPSNADYIIVSGTTTITSFSAAPAGRVVVVRFSGALTLTHNGTNLILQNAQNYLTVAGDVFTFVSEGAGNWREISRRYNTGKVAFPASAVGTTDVNTLDDYEQGSWTPAIAFGGAAVDVTYVQRTGQYTKIGNIVHCVTQIYLSSNGSSTGAATVTGLPFTVDSNNNFPCSVYLLQGVTFANFVQAGFAPSTTTIVLAEVTEAGTRTDLADTDFADTARIELHGTFPV